MFLYGLLKKYKIHTYAKKIGKGTVSILRMNTHQKSLYVFYTLFIWTMYYLMSYCMFFSTEATSSLGIEAGFVVLVMASISMIIPTPGGIGSYHLFISYTISLYNIDDSIGKSFSFMVHSLQLLIICLMGIISTLIILSILSKKNNYSLANLFSSLKMKNDS